MTDGTADDDPAPEATASHGGGGQALLEGLEARSLLLRTGVGFLIAVVLVYLLGYVVGWGEIVETVSGADPFWVAAGALSTAVGLAAWGKTWQIVLSVVGVDESYRRLVVTYFAATFANYITPLGQAGGEPFIAYVLSKDTDASYQDSLASVVTADILNLLPFFNFAVVGLVWLLLQASLSQNVERLAWGLALLAVGIPVLVYVGWRHRTGVERGVLRLVRPVAERTDRVTVEGARRRIDEFYVALERIAASPWKLVYSLLFSYVGWVFFALPMYFGALALGYVGFDPLVVLFVVPASTLAGMVPTPGGTAAVEGAIAVLLVSVAGLTSPEAVALALVYRVTSYWFAILVGGAAAFWVIWRADL